MLQSLDDSFSAPRRLFGWLSEKALQLKLMADDPDNGALRLLESVELLGLGVHGKRGMWKALDANKVVRRRARNDAHSMRSSRRRKRRKR